jgi:SAM-dependent methyltransferase
VDDLLDEPFGNWHVDTVTQSHQLRVTKKLEAVVHTTDRARPVEAERGHDREKPRLLAEDDPVFRELGITDAEGRVKPSRQAKLRQVEEFLRLLDASVTEALDKGHLRRPTAEEPLRIADLGCGNAYLTFAADRFLSAVRGLPVRLVGVDVKEQARRHNTEVAERLGVADEVTFVAAGIDDVVLEQPPHVVLALHACDTATDDALARAVEWEAPLVLAAPCCHKDLSRQLRQHAAPGPYNLLTRDGILRERFADTLTDALRAALLRMRGYRVEVVEFVGSRHTPRNTLIRAVAGADAPPSAEQEYAELTGAWQVQPRLADLLDR